MKTITLIAFVACLMSATGCGSDNKLGRLSVSGKITLDDKPLDSGSIEFFPSDSQGVSAGGVVSADGSYSVEEDKGLPPGKYTVSIFSPMAAKSTPNKKYANESDALVGEPGIDRIPEEFNNSEQIVEVTVDGPNTFDFDIKTK